MSSINSMEHDNDTMQPLRSSHHDTTNIDDDGATDTERARDDVPVLDCENGGCKVKPLTSKKTHYLRSLKLPRLGCPVRCREGLILSIGVVLTCLALGLIVAGAIRSEDHGSRSAFLHVSSLILNDV
ncbi:hypothetical protein C0Q70_16534 [Pomacea canaliculata]|uniref:Uncharacterized protein n=1 Tax=Pomacea canaliculata TaxID=400727 RepID=A0A2T7NQ23_POMCA|nr:hypothetical protein C0Q70_16534 [Pomacea canaliculata]